MTDDRRVHLTHVDDPVRPLTHVPGDPLTPYEEESRVAEVAEALAPVGAVLREFARIDPGRLALVALAFAPIAFLAALFS